MKDYDFELERIEAEIKRVGARKVVLQFPEGLKDRAVEIAAYLEAKTGVKTIIMADPTYGACDTKKADAERLEADLIVHFGHNSYLS
jgi:2-(3-amino-3-carboxypropyl)histidine synthase